MHRAASPGDPSSRFEPRRLPESEECLRRVFRVPRSCRFPRFRWGRDRLSPTASDIDYEAIRLCGSPRARLVCISRGTQVENPVDDPPLLFNQILPPKEARIAPERVTEK